jgi:hypothetical protein
MPKTVLCLLILYNCTNISFGQKRIMVSAKEEAEICRSGKKYIKPERGTIQFPAI